MDASLVWNFNASRPDRRKEEEGNANLLSLSLSLYTCRFTAVNVKRRIRIRSNTLVPVFKQLIREKSQF